MIPTAFAFSTPTENAGRYVSSMSCAVTTAANPCRPASSLYAA